jgi:hypothetical protein
MSEEDIRLCTRTSMPSNWRNNPETQIEVEEKELPRHLMWTNDRYVYTHVLCRRHPRHTRQ